MNIWLESLWRDCRFAGRMLSKTPGFTAVAVLTLMLGIGVNVALFTLLDDEFLRPRQLLHPEEVWAIVPADPGGKPRFFNFSTPYYEAIRKNSHVFTQIGDIFRASLKHRIPDGLEEISGNIVSANYFGFIGKYPLLGRAFLPEEDLGGCAPVAIISYDFWQEQFGGKADVLEKTLDLDGHDFQVIGVTPPGFLGLWTGSVQQNVHSNSHLTQRQPAPSSLPAPTIGVVPAVLRPRIVRQNFLCGSHVNARERW